MGQISKEELLFLSNLMHIKNEKPFSEIWDKEIWEEEDRNLGEIIGDIDTQKLATEYADETFDGEISGAEWAKMLEEIKQNDDICDLKLVDLERDDKNALSVCLHNDSTGETYVVFRGTGAGEWPDNFEGGYAADTQQQRRALAFVNRQGYSDITVVGHSKGGNKAKYVALLSDKVTSCVSFDGQGFSPAFWEKYGPLIEKNKEKITCYALDYDFVNILLPDIFKEKHYANGHGVDNFAQNHSPNSFFNEEWKFDECNQSYAMGTMHNFINYIINTAGSKEVAGLMDYLGNVLNFVMGKQAPDYEDDYPKSELMKFVLAPENADELGTLIAYMVQYEKGGDNIVNTLCDVMMGMDTGAMEKGKLAVFATVLKQLDETIGLENVICNIERNYMLVLSLLMPLGIFSEDEIMAIIKVFEVAKLKQKVIPLPDKQNCKNQSISSVKRDFSDEMRANLLQLIKEVENEDVWDFSRWDMWYHLESWCDRLNIENYRNNVQEYHRKVIDMNQTTEAKMQKIFDAIDTLDHTYGQLFQTKVEEFASIAGEVRNIMA